MGYYVHLSVVFACDHNECVATIAKRHLNEIKEPCEAVWFLKALSERTGKNPGPKGGVSTWGIIGNYTSASNFAESLRQFWIDLLTQPDSHGGPLDFEHIMIFYEEEQSEQAKAIEVFYENGGLVLKHHNLPFAWMQM